RKIARSPRWTSKGPRSRKTTRPSDTRTTPGETTVPSNSSGNTKGAGWSASPPRKSPIARPSAKGRAGRTSAQASAMTQSAGQPQSFYVLKIMENGMKILIPINKVGSVGLRSLIDERAVSKVYQILRQKDISVDSATWNRRYREYMEKIKTGSVFEIAEVLRDLYLLKFDKDLSFGERKMLDTARNLLIKELSLAKGVNEDQIETDLKQIFNC